MVKSKTYTAVNGLNYIQDSELAFATIYVVKREGTQYDLFLTGMIAARTYSFDDSTGTIYFYTAFDGGAANEKVYVLYKPVSSGPPVPPPGVCVAGAIVPITLPSAIEGVLYNQNIELTGTAPFTLSGVTIPAWLTISNSGNTVNITGTPDSGDVASGVLIEFTVNNCVANNDTFSQIIEVYAATPNFFVSNISSYGVTIERVIPTFYAIVTGSFPAGFYTGVTGVHSGFSGGIGVEISGIVFPQTLTLKKNGVDLEILYPTVDDIYTFADQTFITSDEILIILN